MIANQQNTQRQNTYDVIIIGGGPAGATAALYTSRADLSTLVIDKGLTTGALGVTGKIANYPGVHEGISGSQLLDRMREQAKSFQAEFVSDKVIGVDLVGKDKTVFGNGGAYSGRSVIVATGSMGRGHKIKGEAELLGKGVSYCATCDAAFFRGQDVLVAGSTDEAVEEALYLKQFVRHITFLCPKRNIQAPAKLVGDLMEKTNVTIHYNAKLLEIIGKEHVESAHFMTEKKSKKNILVNGAFIYLQGGRPITDFLADHLPVSESGCVSVDQTYRTTLPGVYAVGDVLCDHVKQVIIAAGEGAVAGMTVEKDLRRRGNIIVDWEK